MGTLKALLRKVFCLPPILTAAIAVPSFVLVMLMLYIGGKTWLSYAAYLLSAYALIISVTALVRLSRREKKHRSEPKVVQKLRANPLGDRLLSDMDFRSELSVYGGFAGNLFYSALNILMGLIYRSAWHFSLAAYYILLSLMRGWLSRCLRKRPAEQDVRAEFRSYRVVGFMLLFMNQALAGMVFYMVNRNKGSQYPGVLIYAMAAYAFYITVMAIINVFKYRKRHSPVLSAAKNISLTASLVSMLSLETAMLAAFSSEGAEFRRTMTGSLGAAVCTIVLGMAIYMIVRSNKILKEDARNERKTGQL